MLKWFKKIKERFFEDDEQQYETYEHEIEDEQYEETETQQVNEAVRRQGFKFPIISDAEIYGWEEEEAGRGPLEKRPIITEEEIAFEPIPLYQHERWPQQEKMKVHRANDEPKSTKSRREMAEPTLPLQKQFEQQIHHNVKRRFEPTKVPSPIFGYRKPNPRNKPNRSKKQDQNQLPKMNEEKSMLKERSTFIDHVKAITTYPEEQDKMMQEQPTLEEQEVAKTEHLKETPMNELDMQISEELQAQEETVEYVENDAFHDKERSTAEKTVVITTSEIDENEVNEQEEIKTEVVDLKETKSVGLPTEMSSDPTMKDEGVNCSEVIHDASTRGHETTSAISEESETLTEAESVEVDEKVEDSSERIVPFNVLMLKSDKQRLLATQIRDEQLSEKKHQHSEENPSEKDPIDESRSKITEESTTTSIEENEDRIVEQKVLTDEERLAHYALPPMQFLEKPEAHVDDEEWLTSQSEKLEESLSHFGVQATVIEAVQGPTVTSFELTVGQGTKVSRIRNLTDDLKLALAARDIRIQAPIPGKSSIGIEIPNKKARPVRISEVIQSTPFEQSESPMEAVLGLGLTGDPVTLDLRKMPHGLIAGATGSGKSVCINSILVSLLYKASPVDLKMMLIDPKMVELAPYNGIPHLISPVITDVKAATAALKWAVQEMERRYELLAHAGVRNIEAFNKQAIEHRQFAQKMPYLLIVIDELADLMMMAPADVEVSISRIAQKARACGIHLIIATQRPSVDVITGIIKANIPTRIAFSVSSQVDSRTMIDTNGAERLLGKGDMLYVGNGESTPIRLQGTFVTDEEIDRIIEHVQSEASPNYLFGQDELLKSAVEEDEDPLFLAACEFIYEQNSASTSMLQRNFSIGYNRAAKLMDRLEHLGFISPQQGSKARDVYVTEQDLNELKETIL